MSGKTILLPSTHLYTMEIPANKIKALAKLYNQPTRYCFELRKLGKKMVTEEERRRILVFVPTTLHFMGIRMPFLKKIASETTKLCKDNKEKTFALLNELWKDAVYDGRMICAEILKGLSSKYPEECFKFIETRLTHIGDWGICDKLACESMKKLLKNNPLMKKR